MTGLSLEQIDALVAHELAHVRRHDYLVNLAQSAIETLLFYHPAVWLVSGAVRHERELCCDDIALEVCGGDSVTYASALADLEQMRIAEPALAANGGSLLVRVKRILGHDAAAVSRSRTNWSAGVALMSLALVLLPINAARPKATALPADAEIVSAETSLGDGVAPQLRRAPTAGVVGVASANTQPSATNSQPGGIVGITPLPPAIDVTRAVSEQPAVTGVADRPQSAIEATQAKLREIAQAAVPYRLAASDVLRINVYVGGSPQPDFRLKDYAIAADGSIRFPLIGQTAVAGRTAAEAGSELRKRLIEGGLYADCTVDVVVLETQPGPAPGAPQSTIAPGQLLRLEVTVGVVRQVEFSKDYTVQPDGFISLPYVGRMKVAGLTVDAAQDAIRALLSEKGTLPGAKVVASLEGRSSDSSIFVLGEVNAPSVYPWRDGMTIAQAISLAGGAKTAGTPVEVVLTSGTIAKPTDLTQPLPAGATVNVLAFRSIAVKVQGAVVKPGNVTMREDKTALPDVLTMAGGLTPAAGVTIRIKRAGAADWLEYSVSDLTTGRLGNIKLAAGDTVDVPVAPRYYVQGFVNSPGDLQWEPNMSLQRAIFKAGGQTKDGALNRISVKRLNRESKKYEEVDLGKDPMAFIIQPNDVIEVPKKRM